MYLLSRLSGATPSKSDTHTPSRGAVPWNTALGSTRLLPYRHQQQEEGIREAVSWVHAKLFKIQESFVYTAKRVMESGGTKTRYSRNASGFERSNQDSKR